MEQLSSKMAGDPGLARVPGSRPASAGPANSGMGLRSHCRITADIWTWAFLFCPEDTWVELKLQLVPKRIEDILKDLPANFSVRRMWFPGPGPWCVLFPAHPQPSEPRPAHMVLSNDRDSVAGAAVNASGTSVSAGQDCFSSSPHKSWTLVWTADGDSSPLL